MKKIVLLTALLLVFTGVYAQMSFGAKLGLNIANVSGDDVEDADAKIGFHVGGLMQYFLTDDILIQPELLFTQKGSQFEDSDKGDGWSEKYEMKSTYNYLEIPILAKYNFDMDNIKLQPYLGPALGILMNAKYKVEWKETFNGQSASGSSSGDIEDTEDIEFGLVFGLDAIISENFLVGLRYNLGLTDIDKDADVKNNVFMISLGYLFK